MSDKQNCSILKCASYVDSKNVVYFRFPLDDQDLLKKWLDQIKRPNWYPTKMDVICSRHFKISDINNPLNIHIASLKSNAIPSIFPNKTDPKTNSPSKISSKTPAPSEIVKPSMLIKQEIDQNSPEPVVMSPKSDKNTNSTPNCSPKSNMSKSSPVVSKSTAAGSITGKPQTSIPEPIKGTPGRKRKVVEAKKELLNDFQSKESDDQSVKKELPVKRPVLRICVNKKFKAINNIEVDKQNENEEIFDEEEEDPEIEQIVAKSAIFRLDPVTKQIILLRRKPNGKLVRDTTYEKIPINTQKIDISTGISHKYLKEIYDKEWKSCQNLQRQLEILKKRQMTEQLEIKKLQNQLLILRQQSQIVQQKKTNENSNKEIDSDFEKKEKCNETPQSTTIGINKHLPALSEETSVVFDR